MFFAATINPLHRSVLQTHARPGRSHARLDLPTILIGGS
jgi:hypothetical protein